MKFSAIWKRVSPDVINFLLRYDIVRRSALRKAEEKLYENFVVRNEDDRPPLIQEARCLMLKNLLHTVNAALSDGRIAPEVFRAVVNNFIGRILLQEEDRTREFHQEHGVYPPAFLTISPTRKCNLFCTGCYASSSAGDAETLGYDIFNRIIREKKELWGSYFNVISGGEPLLYKSGGKTLFDILEENSDCYFMMYTNSTLITKQVAERMAGLGNITPAISVEGFEKETDTRRGRGVFRRIVSAMENLREAGVPFGISATATRLNAESIMSDEFTDFYFNKMGAIYGWVFQYMPIGRSITIDLMITPEQRLALFRNEQRMIKESRVFLVDFWNGGPYSLGCISAGRPGGYFYIDWNGNMAPCAFFPYYLSNIHDIYREGRTLNDVLFSPYFESIRDWQNGYGYRQPASKMDNLIVPCMIRDHFEDAYGVIKQYGAKPLDNNAEQALGDSDYRRRMAEYGKDVKAITQELWEQEFLGLQDKGNNKGPEGF
ncbi:MAG: radical SAM/SPASM domain-containing protein [Nitrospiraceae bacterium]|nr:radical SAM/SPASM domain-containing protein [Nitrospiraceae bacterium]